MILCFILLSVGAVATEKVPIVVITDCYHPYQDPGDNLDLIQGFASPYSDLRAVILDISDAFRKDTADHPTLWKDPRGPREGAIIQVEQLNYIFNRRVPFAYGPLEMMKSEQDKMLDIPAFEDAGIDLLFRILRQSNEPVDVLSFGSARVLAVAYNREPQLMKKKIRQIHLSAGTASKDYVLGSDKGANMIPGGEWNVALDVFAFTRLLRSDLPIAIYPCAGKDGGFVKDVNNTYWTLHSMDFLREMSPKLQAYLDFSFGQSLKYDYLRAMDAGAVYSNGKDLQFNEFFIWETAIWLNALRQQVVKTVEGEYLIRQHNEILPSDKIIVNSLRPCKLTEVRNDGRFQFEYTDKTSNFSIYYRDNPDENDRAMNVVVPQLFKSYHP
ncbi:hypothetical protein JGH11_07195 [Dysgonomonas sp. Marseille-P4677]|nr:hypothetical protein [Dysgonomonas sp. Marseille-P4677]